MNFLKDSLNIFFRGTDLLMYAVGVFILCGLYFYFDLVFLKNRREFKKVFGVSAGKITAEKIDQIIVLEYGRLCVIRDNFAKTSAILEKELMEKQLEEGWEKIRDMCRCAEINGFNLSRNSESISKEVDRMVVIYVMPFA